MRLSESKLFTSGGSETARETETQTQTETETEATWKRASDEITKCVLGDILSSVAGLLQDSM